MDTGSVKFRKKPVRIPKQHGNTCRRRTSPPHRLSWWKNHPFSTHSKLSSGSSSGTTRNIGASSTIPPKGFTSGWWKNRGIYRQLQHRAALSEKMQGPAGRKRNLELIWYPGPAQVYLGEANFTGPGKPCWKNTLPCLFPTAMTTTAMCSEGRQRSVSARGF